MTEEQLAEMEANLRAVTDKVGRLMDQVAEKGFIPVFRCGHSGLYFKGDYIKEWGRLYGIGLGPDPKSEVLDTDYHCPPPAITPDIRRIEQIMHPVRVSGAQVDLLMVDAAEASTRWAIPEREDVDMYRRIEIIRPKQLVNPKSQIPQMHASWERARKGLIS